MPRRLAFENIAPCLDGDSSAGTDAAGDASHDHDNVVEGAGESHSSKESVVTSDDSVDTVDGHDDGQLRKNSTFYHRVSRLSCPMTKIVKAAGPYAAADVAVEAINDQV